jgi:hypothetical protein
MKISEVIDQLTSLKDEYGDITVVVGDSDEPLDYVEHYPADDEDADDVIVIG